MKRGRGAGLALFICFLILMGGVMQCFADSAEVLPKGVFSGTLENYFYLPITERFTPNGGTESIAADFNATLGSNIFPELGILEQALGLPPGSANIGRSIVSFDYHIIENIASLQYGLTDKLSIGIRVPYEWATNHVEARLGTRDATFGINPVYGNPAVPEPLRSLPLLPIKGPLPFHGIPLTTNQAKALLSGGLPGIPGFGFEPFGSWTGEGVEDTEAGFRYQYLKTQSWRLALTGGVRFPTGRKNDPDNLTDIGFGSGEYAFLFRLNNDYIGIKNLLLNTTFRYDLYLPDTTLLRIPPNVNQPLTRIEEMVDRKLGDVVELEGSARYQLPRGFSLSLLYRYSFKVGKDSAVVNGIDVASLEDITDWSYHLIRPGISYSTLPLFMEKKFPVPLIVSLDYEDVFAGTNRFLKQQDVTLSVTVLF